MSTSENKQKKSERALRCCSDELMQMMTSQMQLMTELIKQNNELITQTEAREQFLLEVIEQNNELLSEREDEDDASQYLDMDD